MIYRNPKDEEKIIVVFRAYVEEWGPENITLMLPQNWVSYVSGPKPMGRVRVEFSTVDGISIRVNYGAIRHIYSLPFDPAN